MMILFLITHMWLHGSAKALRSRTSNFATLISHNFKSTYEIFRCYRAIIEKYVNTICKTQVTYTVSNSKNWMCVSGGFCRASHIYWMLVGYNTNQFVLICCKCVFVNCSVASEFNTSFVIANTHFQCTIDKHMHLLHDKF